MGWEHKDRVYLHPRRYETAGKKGWGFAGIDIQLQENEMTFEEWLDYLNLVAKEPSQKSGFQPLKKVLMT